MEILIRPKLDVMMQIPRVANANNQNDDRIFDSFEQRQLRGDKRILLVDDDPFNLQSLRIIVNMAINQL